MSDISSPLTLPHFPSGRTRGVCLAPGRPCRNRGPGLSPRPHAHLVRGHRPRVRQGDRWPSAPSSCRFPECERAAARLGLIAAFLTFTLTSGRV